METCRYCGGSGTHAPGCPAGVDDAASASARRKFTSLPDWLQGSRPDRCRFCRGIGEHAAECSVGGAEKPEFENIDLLNAALAFGDPKWQDGARAFCKEHGMSDREVDAAIAHQRLRDATHEAMDRAIEERERTNPEPTAEELSMGAYLESIEPQVRDAVRVMRKKGYATASSGFGDLHFQSIDFSAPDLLDLTRQELAKLGELGAERNRKGTHLSFPIDEADIGRMTSKWDAIAEALPDLGRTAPAASFPAAERFRRKRGPTAAM